jgi:hypothetical protein
MFGIIGNLDKSADRIILMACGKAFYACQTAKYWLEVEAIEIIRTLWELGVQKNYQAPQIERAFSPKRFFDHGWFLKGGSNETTS